MKRKFRAHVAVTVFVEADDIEDAATKVLDLIRYGQPSGNDDWILMAEVTAKGKLKKDGVNVGFRYNEVAKGTHRT